MTIFFNLANCAVFVLILYGVLLHQRREKHARVMQLCFALDLGLLLAVELLRGALGQVFGLATGEREEGGVILTVHVILSVAMLVMWFLMVFWGRRLLRNQMHYLDRHRKGAKTFLLLRLGNLVTAFFV